MGKKERQIDREGRTENADQVGGQTETKTEKIESKKTEIETKTLKLTNCRQTVSDLKKCVASDNGNKQINWYRQNKTKQKTQQNR